MKVLCVGVDSLLLNTRRMVLEAAGFEATCITPQAALKSIATSTFDVAIISVAVSKDDRAALRREAPACTRVIQLESFIEPQELLDLLGN